MLQVTINGQKHQLIDGLTINEALRTVGVEIPTLCHDDRIDPYGPPVVPVIRYGNQEVTLPAWGW